MTWVEMVQLGADAAILLVALLIFRRRHEVAQRVLDEPMPDPVVKYRVIHFDRSGEREKRNILYRGTDLERAKRVRLEAKARIADPVMLEVGGKLRG